MEQLHTFQEFENADDAQQMALLLQQHNIPSRVEKYNPLLDQNIIGRQYNEYVQLKLAPGDFERARQVLIEATEIDMNTVDRHYMLFGLKNNELTDILAKPDEWGVYNYKLAQLILKERGVEISNGKTAELQQEHIAELSKQKSLDGIWIVLCYVFSFIALLAGIAGSMATLTAVYAIGMFPGIMGVIVGWTVMRSMKTLPNGSHIITYDAGSRMHARIIFFFSLFAFVFNIYVLCTGSFQ